MQLFEAKIGILFFNLLLNNIIFAIAATSADDYLDIIGSNYKLSKFVVPRHYNMNITIDPVTELIGYCECNIVIEVHEVMPFLRLHYSNLKLYESQTILYGLMGSVYKTKNNARYYEYNSKMQIVKIYFASKIRSGTYMLMLRYTIFNYDRPYYSDGGFDHKNDLFITSFMMKKNNNTRTKKFIATNFRSVEARKVFPCFDEMDLKATFYISINTPKNYQVFSIRNSAILEQDVHKNNWKWTAFNISSTISTRDLSIVITNVATNTFKANNSKNIWTKPDLRKHRDFAVQIINRVMNLEFIPDFKTAESLTKMIQFAVPGAEDDMGKSGLIVYKETSLIYDEEIDPIAHKMEVACTVVRAIIHQWLDMVILPFSWSEYWLNEGLVILFRLEILDKIFPKSSDLLVVQIQHECLHMDTEYLMNPLSYTVYTPIKIKSLFSFNFYIKAPTVLRMLKYIVGPETFQKVINSHLEDTIEDIPSYNFRKLWPILNFNLTININEKLPNYTVQNIIRSWASEIGYPIIEVVRRKESTVAITLYHYNINRNTSLCNASLCNTSIFNSSIPITVTTQTLLNFSDTRPYSWIIPNYKEEIIVPINKKDWIIVNLQQTGYYRVKYDYTNWELIANYLNSTEYKNIHVINRAQLIDDAYHFWVAHQLNYSMFKRVTEYLRQETDFIAWYPMFQAFKYISQFLPFQKIKPLKDHMLYILNMLHNELNYTESSNETDLIKCLRQEAARWACTFGDSKCQTFVTALLQNHLKDPINHKLLPGWKDWIYCKSSKQEIKDRKIWDDWLTTFKDERKYTSIFYNYFPCAKLIDKDPTDDILLYLFNLMKSKTIKNIYIPCQIVAKHANENINHLATNFKFYNTIIRNKIKLLYIIINNAYSDYQIYKIRQFIQDVLIDNIKNDMQNILYIINRRAHHINNQKSKLIKLLQI